MHTYKGITKQSLVKMPVFSYNIGTCMKNNLQAKFSEF